MVFVLKHSRKRGIPLYIQEALVRKYHRKKRSVNNDRVEYKFDRYRYVKKFAEQFLSAFSEKAVAAHEEKVESCELGVLDTHEVGPESLAQAIGSPAVYERNAQDLRRHGVEVPFPLCWGEFRRGDVFMSPFHRGEFFVVRGRRVEIVPSSENEKLVRSDKLACPDRFLGVVRAGLRTAMGTFLSGKCKVAISVEVRRILSDKVDSVVLKHVDFQTVKYVKVPNVQFARRMMLLEAL